MSEGKRFGIVALIVVATVIAVVVPKLRESREAHESFENMGLERTEAAVALYHTMFDQYGEDIGYGVATIRGHDDFCENHHGEPEELAKLSILHFAKSPSTAEFPRMFTSKVDDCSYEVNGEVDLQNSFGAMRRRTFTFTVRYDEALNSWVDLDLDVR